MIDDRGHQPLFPSVATTNRAGRRGRRRHLLDQGRRSPVVVRGDERFGCTEERLEGFGRLFAEAGFPIPAEPRGATATSPSRAAVPPSPALVGAGVAFDAVFAHNDLSAAGAIQALRDAGVKVPDDVAVVGFDDIPLAGHTDPTLTTVRQPLHEMGRTAARILLTQFEGLPLDQNRCVLPTSLVVRGSSVAA